MKNFFKKYWTAGLVLFIFFVLLYSMLKENSREKLFQKSNTTFAVLIEEYHESERFRNGRFYFFVNKRRFEIKEFRNFKELSKGDTVLIEYAVEDPSVARVVDKYYMKKYKHLKNR
ncbi:MAG: hypothetical protein IT221_05165 [Fluviicola sp.]|nr:hypothetical protein [Fluviicola sp.]